MRKTLILMALLAAHPVLAAQADTAASTAPVATLSAQAAAPVAAVDAFAAALQAGRLDEVAAWLDPQVQVFESGHVEAGRAAYLAEHAAADAAFLKTATVARDARSVEVSGELAWVATRSTIQREGKRYASLESMLLRRGGDGWRIVHIHWSSRELK